MLPGTCIGLVYEDTRANFQRLLEDTAIIIEEAVKATVGAKLEGLKVVRVEQLRPHFETLKLDSVTQGAVLFNTLSHDRFEHLRCQLGDTLVEGNVLVNGLGMALVDKRHLEYSMTAHKLTLIQDGGDYTVENRYYKCVLSKDGSIHSFLDKRTKNGPRQLAKDRLNKLTIHQDVPFFWDAWDIMLHSFETATELRAAHSEVVEVSDSRIRVRFVYKTHLDKSTIEQAVCFYSDTARVDFVTDVDWHEEKKLLKAYFPVDIRTDYATFDIQFGTIRRATHANTSWDAAKHEVFGHKWCDLSEARYGVALLNDSKYGYSVRDCNIGLSLLKAAKFPDHTADMGRHLFTYSLLAHDRPLADSSVFEEAQRLNTPLWVAVVEGLDTLGEDLPVLRDQLVSHKLVEIDSPNVVVSAFKRGDRDTSRHILRLFEDRGEQTIAKVKFNLDFSSRVQAISLLNSIEQPIEDSDRVIVAFDKERQELTIALKPYKFVTFDLEVLSTE